MVVSVHGCQRAMALLLCVVAACDDAKDAQAAVTLAPRDTAANNEAPVAPPSTPTSAATPSATRATKASVEAAITWLDQQVRVPAGDPENPWALAHGLLAFGQAFKTRDGKSAIDAIASFAEHGAGTAGGADRYAFPSQRNGKPVEPHTYLLVKTFLEIDLDPAFALRTADGSAIDVRRLLTDMAASVHAPKDDHEWHDAAWWLSALAMDETVDDATLAPLIEAALVRLEADDSVIAAATALDPTVQNAFSPEAPMGAAKRNKTHVYGHPCGGLHFFQAVLRGAKRSASSDVATRLKRQVQLLIARYNAERTLYENILRANPASMLLISGQQLKFFGHLLETFALVEQIGPLRQDFSLVQTLTAVRQGAASDVLTVVSQLQQIGAYARLNELAARQPQLYLDLIGDGCHAIHGLRETLPVLPSP